jgi:hypothetical protein
MVPVETEKSCLWIPIITSSNWATVRNRYKARFPSSGNLIVGLRNEKLYYETFEYFSGFLFNGSSGCGEGTADTPVQSVYDEQVSA